MQFRHAAARSARRRLYGACVLKRLKSYKTTTSIYYNNYSINHYLFYWSQLWKLCLLFTQVAATTPGRALGEEELAMLTQRAGLGEEELVRVKKAQWQDLWYYQ